MKVKKAIITAAGYGTRFLPATKNVPKELLPVINKPTIHYVVENCINAGIKDIIIITKFGNHAVEDYFDTTPALEMYLEEKGKFKELEEIRDIYSSANFVFIRQDPTLPYGNAAPLYSARNLVAGEPFIYSFGDDIVLGENAGVIELIELFEKNRNIDVILNCTRVGKDMFSKLGMVKLKNERTNIIEKIIEKPKTEETPSDIASVSPYLFTPEIFKFLDPEKIKEGKEFLLQDAIEQLTSKDKVMASITKGKWFTTGDPLNYLKATVEIALSRDDLKEEFAEYLKKRIRDLK